MNEGCTNLQRAGRDPVLESLVHRINRLVLDDRGSQTSPPLELPGRDRPLLNDVFVPQKPMPLQETSLTESDLEGLVLKLLLARGNLTGRDIAGHLKLPFILLEKSLREIVGRGIPRLFQLMCEALNITHRREPIDYLIDRHYRTQGRPFRCCQPRDLLLQIRNYCIFQGLPIELTRENIDFAVENYFTVM
jgi:hypothetical protein